MNANDLTLSDNAVKRFQVRFPEMFTGVIDTKQLRKRILAAASQATLYARHRGIHGQVVEDWRLGNCRIVVCLCPIRTLVTVERLFADNNRSD